MPMLPGRKPTRIQVQQPDKLLRMAMTAAENGDTILAFDLIEQIVDEHPALALPVLEVAYNIYQAMPDKSRYALYQSRHFTFTIPEGARVLDIGSGHIPFPFATDLADIALSDDTYGRAGLAFKRLDGRTVHECSVEDLPFEDKSFDFVYCSHVLEHTLQPEKACQELMRVARRGYIETPTAGKDTFMHTAAISHHRWAVEIYKETLEFRRYTEEQVRGTGCNVLMKMHCSAETQREKAFSALLYLKAARFDTMLLWEDDFAFAVR